MQRTYLSREMTRALALDHPIGDPFGGTAYGERNGPAVALIGAALSIEVGLTIGITSLVGGLMVAGGVLSGLGAITGNETLSKLGMVAGLAGGAMGMMGYGMPAGMDFMTAASSAFTDDIGISGLFGGSGGAPLNGADVATQVAAPVETAMPKNVTGFGQPSAAVPSDLGSGVFNATGADATRNSIFGVNGGFDAVSQAGKAAAESATKLGGSSSGLLGFWNGQSDLTKYGLMNAGSSFASSLASAPSEEQTEQNAALIDAQIAKVQQDTSMSKTQQDAALWQLDLAKRKLANQQFTNFSSMIPTANPNATVANTNANPLYQQKA